MMAPSRPSKGTHRLKLVYSGKVKALIDINRIINVALLCSHFFSQPKHRSTQRITAIMQTSSQQRESCALVTLREDERPKRMSSHRASGSERISHWPTEITRWIARWENEGGAVLKENSVERTMLENNT